MLSIQKKIRNLADDDYSQKCQRFFKTGPGEYAHGDLFLGVRSPDIRKLAKEAIGLKQLEIKKLIHSKYHEERLLGLLILVNQYAKAQSDSEKVQLYQFYIKSFPFINNWDLVDVTCPHLIGRHLIDRDRHILYEWAQSKNLWVRRIAIVTNWWFIRKGDLSDVFKIAKLLLKDEHDLIHKAVGWMLREAGKKDIKKLEAFLSQHYKKMPRVMLRYAIEKMPETKRKRILSGHF